MEDAENPEVLEQAEALRSEASLVRVESEATGFREVDVVESLAA